ncbi:MAG: glycerol dehydrogenase [Ferruginibacter sp.]
MTTSDRVIKSVFPGKYIQGEGLIAKLPEFIKTFGGNGMIICSPTPKKNILASFTEKYTEEGILLEEFRGECCETEIKRLYDIVVQNQIKVLVGMGGGKVIDTAKIVADKTNIPVIIVPTIASTDAPCSGVAVIYTDDGVVESIYYQKMNPQVVLVDIDVIAQAPARFLRAGIGDALSTWFEARSCDRTQSMNECGGYSTMAGLNLAKLCYDSILEYGSAAILACENNIITPALHYIVEANTLLSGIGFESVGLAAAHSIHNGLSALDETHSYYHGEKVAFGVLASLHLTNAAPAEILSVYKFCQEIGLPTTLAEIGIVNTDRKNLLKVATKACEPQESIHKEAGEITPEKVLYAIIAADAMGKKMK